MKIQYVGMSDVREISKKDFKANDIEQDDVVWNADNDFTATVSASAGEWLMKSDPDNFKEAKKK